jgi:hypothetical protein
MRVFHTECASSHDCLLERWQPGSPQFSLASVDRSGIETLLWVAEAHKMLNSGADIATLQTFDICFSSDPSKVWVFPESLLYSSEAKFASKVGQRREDLIDTKSQRFRSNNGSHLGNQIRVEGASNANGAVEDGGSFNWNAMETFILGKSWDTESGVVNEVVLADFCCLRDELLRNRITFDL